MKNAKMIMRVLFYAFAGLSFAAAETRLLRYPDIHKDQIAFCYGGDIYTASVSGRNVTRLTSFPGEELLPKFSPDGQQIAFTAEFEGNKEIYVMSVRGGKPKRLTFYPADEYVVDWHPDGSRIIFRSNGSSFSYRFNRLHSVSVQGGLPTVLAPAEADLSSFDDRGDRLALCRTSLETLPWKRYRGGAGPHIWTYDLKNHKSELIIDDPSINHHPLWIGDTIYFVSDRGQTPEQNLWAYDGRTRKVRQLTFYKEWGVRWPSKGGDKIIYENEGRLRIYDTRTGVISDIKIEIALPDDFFATTVKSVKDRVSSPSLSPDGKKIILSARGDLFYLEPDAKSARNLTATSGVNERSPVWSPDGRSYAFISDQSGEEQIYIRTVEDGQAPIQVSRSDQSKLGGLNWSPDGKMIGFSDKRAFFYVVDLAAKETRKIFFNEYFGSERFVTAAWSPDSRWLVFERGNPNWNNSIYLYSFDSGETYRVTDELTNAYNPRFDPDGKFLFWIADCNIAVADSYGDEDHHMTNPSKIIAAALRKDLQAAFPGRIDIDGLGRRITALPLGNSNYRDLIALKGRLIYRSEPDSGESSVKIYDLIEQKESALLNEPLFVVSSARADKFLYYGSGRVGILDVKADQKAADGLVDLTGLTMTVDNRQEWRQMFYEAWRIQRDFFFDENLRGVDWEALKRKYEVFLPFLASRRDLNYLIEDLFAELGQSHVEIKGGDMPKLPPSNIGLLGIDLKWDPSRQLYRIDRIFRGQNWNPDMISPLTLPGMNVEAGDFLLAIDGVSLEEHVNPDSLLAGKAGQAVELTVRGKSDEAGARTVKVVPASYSDRRGDLLRYSDWVLGNIEKVRLATGGRVGYIQIPDTYYPGMESFFRYFYPQIHKEGLIVDIRFNSGGYSPYWMVERLNRSMIYYSKMPYGKAPIKEPGPGFYGVKVCLTNEWVESGGENFASIFRLLKSGPLIGARTSGNLASARDFYLMDRGIVTYPAEGKKDAQGRDFVENVGVTPDIEAINRPEDYLKGLDPQLERCIQEILKKLGQVPKNN